MQIANQSMLNNILELVKSGGELPKDEAFKIGEFLEANNYLNEAITAYLCVLKNCPDLIHLNTKLAVLYHDIGDYESCLTFSKTAIDLGENYPNLWFARGLAFKKLENSDSAVLCFKKALEINDDFLPAYTELASSLHKQARTDKQINEAVNSSYISLKKHLKNHDAYIKSLPSENKIKYSLYKIKHDLEQAKFLMSRGTNSLNIKHFIKFASGLIGNTSRVIDGYIYMSPNEYNNLSGFYTDLIIKDDAYNGKNFLNTSLDWSYYDNEYSKNNNKILIIDDFLSRSTLNELIDFCHFSKIWNQEYKYSYLGTFADRGFSSQTLLKIANELRMNFPNTIGDLDLEEFWAFKYDSKLGKGINVHADFAKINLNFWITPDKYNLDKDSGGMKVYNFSSPKNWEVEDYNQNPDKIYNYLNENNSDSLKIKYKQNRAILFDSTLFHETDNIDFEDSYEGRRVNITFLFGKGLKY